MIDSTCHSLMDDKINTKTRWVTQRGYDCTAHTAPQWQFGANIHLLYVLAQETPPKLQRDAPAAPALQEEGAALRLLACY